MSKAYDGALNMTGAYTHYIDDGQWTSMGAIFAENGNKQVPFNGYYIGPERIAHRPGAQPAANSTNPGRGGWHWLMQPVIDVAPDGRSAKMRTRLFHPAASATGGGIEGGMYPNNQAVLEKGVWKLWTVTIDEPYFSALCTRGWAKPRQAAAGRGAHQRRPRRQVARQQVAVQQVAAPRRDGRTVAAAHASSQYPGCGDLSAQHPAGAARQAHGRLCRRHRRDD